MEPSAGRGRGRGRGVGGEGAERGDLRRPHAAPPEVARTATQPAAAPSVPAAAGDEAKPKVGASKLSANAPEFVPRSFAEPQPQPPVPQQVQGGPQVGAPIAPPIQMQYLCHPVMLQVNNLVVQLTLKPNKFDQVANQLTTMLNWQVQDLYLMKEVITVIFEQGVGEENFRYSGARLCQHLAKHVTQTFNGPTFKSLLLIQCNEELQLRDMYLKYEPARVCGFTLFLAELFSQLVTPNGQPMEVLGQALCKLILTILTAPTDTNLKCAAQVLKFTGSSLDTMFHGEMGDVINKVKDVAMTAPVSSRTRSLLLAVVELRAANWGRGPPSPTQSPASTPTHSNTPLGTVYYGPGGVIQRVEEEPEDSASDTDDLPPLNYGWSPAVEELEGDVAEAFEEFLRLQQ